MDKDKRPKKRPGEPAWEDCEDHDLNEKPGESPLDTVERTFYKIDRAHVLKEQDSEANWDADTSIASATTSHTRAIDIAKRDSQHGRSRRGNIKKSLQANKRALIAHRRCLRYARKTNMNYSDIVIQVAADMGLNESTLWGYMNYIHERYGRKTSDKIKAIHNQLL